MVIAKIVRSITKYISARSRRQFQELPAPPVARQQIETEPAEADSLSAKTQSAAEKELPYIQEASIYKEFRRKMFILQEQIRWIESAQDRVYLKWERTERAGHRCHFNTLDKKLKRIYKDWRNAKHLIEEYEKYYNLPRQNPNPTNNNEESDDDEEEVKPVCTIT